MEKVYKPIKDITVEVLSDNLKKFDFIHNHMGFECDSCGLIPERIYCCWFFDKEKKRTYLRYVCFNCSEKIFKTPGYLTNFISVLRVTAYCYFPKLDEIEDILFIAKNFIMRKNNEYIKNKL